MIDNLHGGPIIQPEQTYHDLYRQSQLNASTCADFLGSEFTYLPRTGEK